MMNCEDETNQVMQTLDQLLDRIEAEQASEISRDCQDVEEDEEMEEEDMLDDIDQDIDDLLEEEDETKSVELGQMEVGGGGIGGEVVVTSKLVDENNNENGVTNTTQLPSLFVDSKETTTTLVEQKHEEEEASVSLSSTGASSSHTFRKTEWDVKKLETFVRHAYSDHTRLEEIDPAKLSVYLKGFFEHAQKTDGMEYEPESLIGFMNSFERFLRARHYPESLLRSDLFKECRVVLKRKRELVRSIGRLVRIKSKDTFYVLLYHRNLLKERGLLNRDNPDTLLAEIYLNNKIYFGDYLKEDKAWRGNLNLVWGDLLLERDPDNGLEYLTLSVAAASTTSSKKSMNQSESTTTTSSSDKSTTSLVDLNNNNINNNNSNNKLTATTTTTTASLPRVYARQPAITCPVEAYKAYKSRRPATCLSDPLTPFYLAPNSRSKPHSKTWYKVLAMSCQRLDALFYCLFKKAQLNLSGLVSMSEKEQQHIVASAMITSQANNDMVVWKTSSTLPTNTTTISLNNSTNSSTTTSKTQSKRKSSAHSQQSVVQPQPAQPIVPAPSRRAALPIKVQVQVQIQVKLPLHSKEQTMSRAIAAATAAAAAAAATSTPNVTSQVINSFPSSFKIQLPFKQPVK